MATDNSSEQCCLLPDGPALFCPSSYRSRGDTCLKLHSRPRDYPAAKAICAEDGARLFNIRSQADNEWLIGHLRSYQSRTGKGRGVWIGLTDVWSAGTLEWEDGTAFDDTGYTNWAEGALDRNDGIRDCVYMDRGYGWKWYIQKCVSRRERHAFICARDPAPPEPTC
ncbi:COLEC12 [Branchiostoma lanceolatum]|uniref:COLEC12 protein n=1 Tax=Branchiostoma lanceolatum TaxID=7740 RepID=A0A8J9YWJ0_BRALA|nr:COLEC12 [Branchiostoma lanceolatum]